MDHRDMKVDNQSSKQPVHKVTERAEPKGGQKDAFKKVLDEKGLGEEEGEEEVAGELKGSIFDVPKKKLGQKKGKGEKEEEPSGWITEHVAKKEVPVTGEKVASKVEGKEVNIANASGLHHVKQVPDEEIDLADDTVDLSQETKATPLATHAEAKGAFVEATANIGTTPIQKGPDQLAQKAVFDLVEEMVGSVKETKLAGEVKTELVLKTPGIFQGAKVTMTSFDFAKGEFNISFENLQLEAKARIDDPKAQELLQQAMAQKGYTVHIIRTNTEMETVLPEPQELFAKGDQEGQGGQKRQGQQEQEEEKG